MNEQSPLSPDQSLDRREARRQRRANRGSSSWVSGLILIILGVAFLTQTTGTSFFPFKNWWALFLLLPAIGALGGAYQMYIDAGNTLTTPARASLITGSILCLFTAAFPFDIQMTFFGPAVIILVGLGIVFSGIFSGKK